MELIVKINPDDNDLSVSFGGPEALISALKPTFPGLTALIVGQILMVSEGGQLSVDDEPVDLLART